MARLIIESADGRGREYKIVGAVVIGRLKTNPVAIDDVKASREHAAVRSIGGEYFLADLDSRNGTFLNGDMIHGQVRLRHRDRIVIGSTEFRFLEDPNDQALRAETAAKAAAVHTPAQAPAAKSPEPLPPTRPETRAVPQAARPEPATLVVSRGPGPFERFLSLAIHLLLFVMSAFIAWWATGKAIRSLMGG
jgi:predicted component of type VI protein secretion system